MSPPASDGQLFVVLQVRSKSSQVREEAWRTVCRASYRVVGMPRIIAFLDHRSCSPRKHGQGGANATKKTTVTGLGWPSSDKQQFGSAWQRRRRQILMTRNTFS